MNAPWPPPLANRETRRRCEHQAKGGYCVLCGTVVVTPESGRTDWQSLPFEKKGT